MLPLKSRCCSYGGFSCPEDCVDRIRVRNVLFSCVVRNYLRALAVMTPCSCYTSFVCPWCKRTRDARPCCRCPPKSSFPGRPDRHFRNHPFCSFCSFSFLFVRLLFPWFLFASPDPLASAPVPFRSPTLRPPLLHLLLCLVPCRLSPADRNLPAAVRPHSRSSRGTRHPTV